MAKGVVDSQHRSPQPRAHVCCPGPAEAGGQCAMASGMVGMPPVSQAGGLCGVWSPSSVLVSASTASAHHLLLHKCFWRAAPEDLLVAFRESSEFSMSCVYKPELDIVSLKMLFFVLLKKLSEQWGSLSSPHIPHAYLSQKRGRIVSWA